MYVTAAATFGVYSIKFILRVSLDAGEKWRHVAVWPERETSHAAEQSFQSTKLYYPRPDLIDSPPEVVRCVYVRCYLRNRKFLFRLNRLTGGQLRSAEYPSRGRRFDLS